MLKIISVVGARPAARSSSHPSPTAIAQERAIEHLIVHTGQHYDADLSDVFFAGLRHPRTRTVHPR